jgi:transcriptional regulator GlxA family with amidase domain
VPERTLLLFLFDDVEVLDFAGPFEVFSVTNELNGERLLNIRTVSVSGLAVSAKNGLSVVPDLALENAGSADILVVPGGYGVRALLDDEMVTGWIRGIAEKAELVLSVCTGSMLLARSGLLDGFKATTHHSVKEEFAAMYPDIPLSGERFVDNGRVITSAGISAGIDMSLYVVERLYGAEIAARTAAYMEYQRMYQNQDMIRDLPGEGSS